MNIDPTSKPSKAAARKARREMQAFTDRVRDTVECPRCKAKPGEYCLWRGNLKTAIHPRRRKLFLLTPSELAPPDDLTAAFSSKVRKG